MGQILIDGMPTFWSDGHISILRRPLHKFSRIFLHVHFTVGEKEKIYFWEDLWWENQPLCYKFPNLYRVITLKISPSQWFLATLLLLLCLRT